jgi:hypothetical protein
MRVFTVLLLSAAAALCQWDMQVWVGGAADQIPVSSITRLTFADGRMTVGGDGAVYDLADIQRVTFDDAGTPVVDAGPVTDRSTTTRGAQARLLGGLFSTSRPAGNRILQVFDLAGRRLNVSAGARARLSLSARIAEGLYVLDVQSADAKEHVGEGGSE